LLAPLALLLAVAATIAVIAASSGSGGGDSGDAGPVDASTSTATGTGTSAQPSPRRPRRATYTVKLNDTLGLISEKTGVSVERLQALNPELDPQSLVVGQTLKLRE
jgi:teichoic acid transport system ATP-binding protein